MFEVQDGRAASTGIHNIRIIMTTAQKLGVPVLTFEEFVARVEERGGSVDVAD